MDNVILRKTWTQGNAPIVDDLRETAFTGESGAHTFIISGQTAKKQAVPITGTITGAFLAANNTTVPLTGEIVDDAAVLTLPQACYAVPGRFILSIYAANDGVTMCIYSAVGFVFRANSERIVYPAEALPSIADLIAEAQEIASSVTADADRAETAAEAAEAAAGTIPTFTINELFNWYVEEHADMDTPFTRMTNIAINETDQYIDSITWDMPFSPDTFEYNITMRSARVFYRIWFDVTPEFDGLVAGNHYGIGTATELGPASVSSDPSAGHRFAYRVTREANMCRIRFRLLINYKGLKSEYIFHITFRSAS